MLSETRKDRRPIISIKNDRQDITTVTRYIKNVI